MAITKENVRTEEELLAIENAKKIANWIREIYPTAVKVSYDRVVKCMSPHHVYHTAYVVIDKGVITLHRGSHGWAEADTLYNLENGVITEYGKDVTNSRTYLPLISFIHEWQEHKLYIESSLQPYEKMANFEV